MRVLKEVPHGWVETGFLEPLKTGTHWREAAAAFSAGGGGVRWGGWISLLCFVVLEKRNHSAVKTGRDPSLSGNNQNPTQIGLNHERNF